MAAPAMPETATLPHRAPPTDETSQVRAGLWMLPAAGLFILGGLFFRGPFLDAALSPAAFSEVAVTSAFRTGYSGLLAGSILLTLGALALYARVARGEGERWALAGLVVFVLHLGALLPILGLFVLAAPALATLHLFGDTAALLPFETTLLLAGQVAAAALYVLAAALFAVAIWRAATLPRWTAVALVAHAPLLAAAGYFAYFAELLGAVLLLAAGVGIAAEVGHEHRLVMTGAVRPRAGAG